MVSGSVAPTYCGIGRLTGKLVAVLQEKGEEVLYLTNNIQKEINPQATQIKVKIVRGSLLSFGLNDIYSSVREFKPQIINFQYQTFGKNYWDAFFPLVAKFGFNKIKVTVTIHEFEGFTMKGKLRMVLPILLADKVLFSDQNQMESACKFFNQFLLKKCLSEKSNTFFITQSSKKKFKIPGFNERKLHLAFHGYIQPPKGLDLLLSALVDFKPPFHLHLLSDFRLLLNYSNAPEIKDYQEKCHKIMLQGNLSQSVTVYGDIDPNSSKFRDVLSRVELAIFPFKDFVTLRRTSLINVLMNSDSLVASTYKEGLSDPLLSSLLSFQPNIESLKEFLTKYQAFSISQKKELAKQQLAIREKMSEKSAKEQLHRTLIF